jgi:hypothetical protein
MGRSVDKERVILVVFMAFSPSRSFSGGASIPAGIHAFVTELSQFHHEAVFDHAIGRDLWHSCGFLSLVNLPVSPMPAIKNLKDG